MKIVRSQLEHFTSKLDQVTSQLNQATTQLSNNNRMIELLIEQIRIMNQRSFGRSSESRLSEMEGQLSVFDAFNEPEVLAENAAAEPEITEVVITSHTRKKAKGKRDSDLEGLPARIFEHKLSAEELAE